MAFLQSILVHLMLVSKGNVQGSVQDVRWKDISKAEASLDVDAMGTGIMRNY